MQYSYGIDASSSSYLVCKKKRLLQRLNVDDIDVVDLIKHITKGGINYLLGA